MARASVRRVRRLRRGESHSRSRLDGCPPAKVYACVRGRLAGVRALPTTRATATARPPNTAVDDDARAAERTRGHHRRGRPKAVSTGTSVYVRLSLSADSPV